MKQHTFTFMGTGAGCGVPAFFCDCPACEEARANPRAQRGDCGVMITGTQRTLIDTPPDIRHYFNREGVRYIDNLIFTHWHYDHVGGLGELEYMVQLLTKTALPTFASPYTLESIGREFEYMMYCLARCELNPFASSTRRCPSRMHLAHTATLSKPMKPACSTPATPASCRPRLQSAFKVSTSWRWMRRTGRKTGTLKTITACRNASRKAWNSMRR